MVYAVFLYTSVFFSSLLIVYLYYEGLDGVEFDTSEAIPVADGFGTFNGEEYVEVIEQEDSEEMGGEDRLSSDEEGYENISQDSGV